MSGRNLLRDREAFFAYVRHLEWSVGIYAALLLAYSIYMFMITTISTQVSDLITNQNAAALKLWASLDYYDHLQDTQGIDTWLPPRLFEEVVEFSKNDSTVGRNLDYRALHETNQRVGTPLKW